MSRILFVSGKGGVGKTRTSLLLSQKIEGAVLTELTHSLAQEAKLLEMDCPRIHRFTKRDLAEEFLTKTIKVKVFIHLLAKSKIFQTLLNLAPNLYELLLMQKWFEVAEKGPLIVDAPSTGHFLAFFDAIQTAKGIFDGGTLRKIADRLDAFFENAEGIEIYLVTLPENSSLLEFEEIKSTLEQRYPRLKIKTVVNRLHRAPISKMEFTPELQELAFKRPKKERERIDQFEFTHRIHEGENTL